MPCPGSAADVKPRHLFLPWFVVLLFAMAGLPGMARAAAPPEVVKFSRNMPANALEGRADSDLVELADGRRIRVGDVRRLGEVGKRIRATAPGSLTPPALRVKPAASGRLLRNSADIAEALKRPDNETLQLPSGRTLTVGQLKLVQGEVERRLGHSLGSLPQRPGLDGPAVKVDANADWKNLLQRPDNTVLETPQGTRITVGELKQTLAATRKSPGPVPSGRR